MPLILAIEPDRHQAAQIAAIAQERIGAELVLADSADRALRALGQRVPDLILTPQLLSPRDDAAITDRLRALGAAATFVQTLTIPALATADTGTASRGRGLLSALRRQKAPAAAPNGCAPEVFADQITVYLERALEARRASGEPEPASPTALDAAVAEQPAPALLHDFEAPRSSAASSVSDVEFSFSDVASGSSHVASGFSRKDPLPRVELEWPVRVEATAPAAAAVPAVDFSEPWQTSIAKAPLVEPAPQAEVDTPVLMEPQVLLDVVAPVEAVSRTTESQRHREEPLIPEPTGVDHVEAGVEGRLKPAPTSTQSIPSIVGVDRTEARSPEPEAREAARPEFTAPAWTETDLTELVEAIAEPATVPEGAPEVRSAGASAPAVPDVAIETPQPAPAATVPEEVPAPAAPRPKATKPASRKRRARPAPPKDDWHFFNPDETRFAALLAKLDEITGTDAASSEDPPIHSSV